MVDPQRLRATSHRKSIDDAPRLHRPRRIRRHQLGPPRRASPHAQIMCVGQQPGSPQITHRVRKHLGIARVVQPHIRDRAALLIGGLRGDARAGVLLIHPTMSDKPCHPSFDVRVNDQNQVIKRRE
ncbi:Uncharacterised protein [Mycobacteroides abscessus subsp. abscessus]|nr:Uncharacterised protein [Mycobacteroides abscessus subsp. abscessus]